MGPPAEPPTVPGHAPRNRILASLPRDERQRILGLLERVPLEFRSVLFDPNRPIEHVYFPEEGVVSIVGLLADGTGIETATTGNEGMVGVPVYLGAMQMAAQAFVQVPGEAYRMRAVDLREEVRRGTALSELLGRYTQALFTLVAQSSACNRKHVVEERCARWLLMIHDRMAGDEFDLTQEFISQMLGVRRATVNEVAQQLQGGGMIAYSRGRMRILNRARLEGVACECYGIIRGEFDRMVEGRQGPDPLSGVPVSEWGKSTVGTGPSEQPEETDEPAQPGAPGRDSDGNGGE